MLLAPHVQLSMGGYLILSDFYLFHHLLHPVCMCEVPNLSMLVDPLTFVITLDTQSSDQVWLTCESPEDLVEKYKEYAHGNLKKGRRVVLDETLLPEIKDAGNIRVVGRVELVDQFVKTVEEQAHLAQRSSETLMILILDMGILGTTPFTWEEMLLVAHLTR